MGEESGPATTPVMAQYLSLRSDPAYRGHLLFFQMGDFFEMFFEDAVVASETLGIALTRRGRHQGAPIPMCGVPVHSVNGHVSRLLRAGHRVALCEQVGSGGGVRGSGGGVMARAVTRVLTPGTLTDEALLSPREHRMLCVAVPSVDPRSEGGSVLSLGLVWVDVSTGTFVVGSGATLPSPGLEADADLPGGAGVSFSSPASSPSSSPSTWKQTTAVDVAADALVSAVSQLPVAELVVPRSLLAGGRMGGGAVRSVLRVALRAISSGRWAGSVVDHSQAGEGDAGDEACAVTLRPDAGAEYGPLTARAVERDWFAAQSEHVQRAVNIVLEYLAWTHNGAIPVLNQPQTLHLGGSDALLGASSTPSTPTTLSTKPSAQPTSTLPVMAMDGASARALELHRPLFGRRRARGSLVEALDRCVSPGGSRLLDARLAAPLTSAHAIRERLDAVQWFLRNSQRRSALRSQLRRVGDLERALGRVCLGRSLSQARDLAVIRDALLAIRCAALAVCAPPSFAPSSSVLANDVPLDASLFPHTPSHAALIRADAPPPSALWPQSPEELLRTASAFDFDALHASSSSSADRIVRSCLAAMLLPLRQTSADGPRVTWSDLPAESISHSSAAPDVVSLLFAHLSSALPNRAAIVLQSDGNAVDPEGGEEEVEEVGVRERAPGSAEIGGGLSVDGAGSAGSAARLPSTIRTGYCPPLDEAVALRDASEEAVHRVQRELREALGVPSLRIRRTAEQGFTAEVPMRFVDSARAAGEKKGIALTWVRTLKSSARFKTPELGKLDRSMVEAAARAEALESLVLQRLAALARAAAPWVTMAAKASAVLDVSGALADAADVMRLCRPSIVGPHDAGRLRPVSNTHAEDLSTSLYARSVRHLVVEHSLLASAAARSSPSPPPTHPPPSSPSSAWRSADALVRDALELGGDGDGAGGDEGEFGGSFVANDVHLAGRLQPREGRPEAEMSVTSSSSQTSSSVGWLPEYEQNRVQIITGPNMGGKSVYLRAAAHVAILAQMGSFVPAEEAVVGVCDRVFTRVGAADDPSRGKSTFRVEMEELGTILRRATPRSLVLLDEVGRGTTPVDGISIAAAALLRLAGPDAINARTLFATHFHELAVLASPWGARAGGLETPPDSSDAPSGVERVLLETAAARLPHNAMRAYVFGVDERTQRFSYRCEKYLGDQAIESWAFHVSERAGVPPDVVQEGRALAARLRDAERA